MNFTTLEPFILHDHTNFTIPEIDCTAPAIDEFPRDLFTKEQRQKGGVVVHVLVSLYLFVALALVCDKYFVPAVGKICHALNMTADVAGATFMALATSAPELFINIVGTFITEGDIGIGTIVGSAVFNILAVAACCGIAAGMCDLKVVPLEWWPLTRDCLAYSVAVSALILFIHDEKIQWYEALCLVLLYIFYIAIMYFDKSIHKCAKGGVKRTRRHVFKAAVSPKKTPLPAIAEAETPLQSPVETTENLNPDEYIIVPTHSGDAIRISLTTGNVQEVQKIDQVDGEDNDYNLWEWPSDKGIAGKVFWVFIWPIHFVFYLTIPDCEKPRWEKWYPLTFIMCIFYIGSLSYLVAWMITVIGDTLRIPDSVMGITFLAAGTSVPEAVSSIIVAKQGFGSMGISNSIGSNTSDILLCLGIPWLLKAAFMPRDGNHFIIINSSGIEYITITLLSSLLILYVVFAANKFNLDKRVGHICLVVYIGFLILASLIEMNAFFKVNLPTCK